MTQRRIGCILGALGALSLTGCSADASSSAEPEDSEALGAVELLLSKVPSDAACLQVTLSGSRKVSRAFDLSRASSSKFSIGGLPIGAVQVQASVFPDACRKLEGNSTPNWVLEKPVTARIDDLDVAKIFLKLVRNGRGELTVDFEAPPGSAGHRDFGAEYDHDGDSSR